MYRTLHYCVLTSDTRQQSKRNNHKHTHIKCFTRIAMATAEVIRWQIVSSRFWLAQ